MEKSQNNLTIGDCFSISYLINKEINDVKKEIETDFNKDYLNELIVLKNKINSINNKS